MITICDTCFWNKGICIREQQDYNLDKINCEHYLINKEKIRLLEWHRQNFYNKTPSEMREDTRRAIERINQKKEE